MKKSLMVFVYCLTLFAITLLGADVYSASKYESEPNENKTTATAINFGDKIVGNMWHALDYDWYSISGVPSGLVSLTAYYEFPDGAATVQDVLFVEVRDGSNKVLADFYIDYFDPKVTTPYIRDINIPSSGTYYIVVHCPSQAKFKRDRYYISMAKGAGENATVKILNEEDSVSLTADEESTATIQALVKDEDGNAVEGALVKFSSLNPDDRNLVFSQGDITNTYSDVKGWGNTVDFPLFSGEKKIEVQYTNTKYDYVKDKDGIIINKSPVSSFFRVALYNSDNTSDKMDLYSVTTDGSVNQQITKQILSDANYYLVVEVGKTGDNFDGIWQVTIPNSKSGGKGDEIGTAVTNSNGIAEYKYKSTEKKGNYTIIASFGNNSNNFKIKQVAGSPAKVNIVDLVEDPDNDKLYINREYTLNVVVRDKNDNLVEDAIPIDTSDKIQEGTKVILRAFDFDTDLSKIAFTDLDKYIDKTLEIKELAITSDYQPLSGKGKLSIETKSGIARYTISTLKAKRYKLLATIEGTEISDPKLDEQPYTLRFNSIRLSNMIAQPTYILADGKSESIISVRLSDIDGYAIAGEPITFKTDCGSLEATTAKTADTTDAETGTIMGVAKVKLIAPFNPCSGKVTAYYGTAELETQVEFYGDGTGSTAASILLETANYTIPANGKSSVVLTATLTDNAGQPVSAGTPVIFTTDKGMFPNGTQIFKGSTPTGGKINLAILSKEGETGKANITCTSGGITQVIQVTFIPVNEDGSPAGESTAYINLTASPTTIVADGKSSLMISAELFNARGGSVPVGTEIIFYADSTKAKFANGLDSFTAATTDDSGKVYVALISSTNPGPVDVWCLSNGVYQLTTITLKGGVVTPDIGTITLTAEPTNIPANGSSSSSIRAEITDITGNPVPEGTSITFTTNAGKFSNNTKSIIVKTANESGIVIVPLISDSTGGFAQVTATSGGATQSTLVTFEGGSNPNIGTITLTANPTSIPADGSSSTSITATVTDVSGKAVPLGTSIDFRTNIGRFSNGTTSITQQTADSSGKVTVSLISDSTSGSAEVTASSGGISQKVVITFGNVGIGTITLTANPTSIPADGSSSSSIKAEIKDTAGKAVAIGTSVVFTTSLGKFSNGQQSITVKTIDSSGAATVSLISSDTIGTATVSASVGAVSQSVIITFIVSQDNSDKAKYLYLSLSKNSVLSDNIDTTTVTATVLDEKNSPIKNATVNFSITAGQISSSFATTDDKGNATVTFSSGPEKKNQTVTITASISVANLSKSIPVVISGSTLTLDNGNKTTLEIGETTTLTVIAKDGGGKPIQYAEITVKSTNGRVQILPDTDITNTVVCSSGQCTGETDFYGELDLSIKGISAGEVTVEVRSEEIDHTIVVKQEYSVIQPEENVQIIYNDDSPKHPDPVPKDYNVDLIVKDYENDLDITGILKITVIVPKPSKIGFFSTLGKFSKTGSKPWKNSFEAADNISTTFDNQEVTAYFSSDNAGISSIYVVNLDDTSQNDSMTAAISASSEQASQLSLQASPTIVAPSSGDIENISVLTATVKNSKDQPVKGAMVIFSIINTVGGGEKIDPGWAITDSSGIATSKFISGSLPSGGEGIKIVARTNNTTITDEVYIVIGGTPGSIVIGRSTVMESAGDSTQYILPMSILVSDAGGHPVAEKEVSLNSWPIQYAKGYFIENPSDSAPDWIPKYNGWYDNEDVNRNTILDAGESDIDGDGITPPNSSAGNIPSTVKTDKDGVANFDLIYLNHYAVWINAEIRATTIVSGTETISSMTFILPALQSDTTPDLKLPPVSPFGSGE